MKKYVVMLFSFMALSVSAQTIKGKVFIVDEAEKKEGVVGAVVQWDKDQTAVVSGADGEFSIKKPHGKTMLIASYVGYHSDTIIIEKNNPVEFILVPAAMQIEQVNIRSRRSNAISAISMEKKEMITFAGLCKMACCNLAESFENSASVTVGYSDAVSGARQIKLLGYAGMYTQMLDETRPIMRGLSSTYGLEYTPGMWLKGIQIAKGVTSVVNGYEALTGQINLEHRKPTDEEPLFVNLFLSDDLRAEANVTSALQINKKLSTVILSHVSLDKMKIDHNDDGFLDMPLKEQYNIGNRWLYVADNGIQLRYGLRFLYEDRRGGEKNYTPDDRYTLKSYGSEITNNNFNAYVKAGFPLRKNKLDELDPLYEQETTSNFAIVTDYVYHKEDAFFGIKDYAGDQNSFYTNLLYQINFGKKHQLIAGGTFTADLYNESLIDRFTTGKNAAGSYNVARKDYNFDRDLYTTGLFGEYTFKLADKFDAVAGVRGDYNNRYGWMFTPRAHVKWNLTPTTVVRGSAGVGYRIMSLLTDNMSMLAT
ncbi:MAG: TonB-dependent receptor, partial [Rikenellaceae bacterium]